MSLIGKFLKSSGVFVLGSVLVKLVGFLMLPFYTAWFAPDQLGYYDVSLAYLMIACEALFLNVWVVILRFMYDYDERDKPKAIASGWLIFGASTAVYLLIALIIAQMVHLPFFWLIVSYGLLHNFVFVLQFAARGYGRNIDFAVSGILGAVIMAVLNFVLIGHFHYGIEALYVSMMVGFIVELIYLEVRVGVISKVFTSTAWIGTRERIATMARYAVPIGLNALFFWFILSYNRVAISQQLSLDDNGVFSVAARFGGLVVLATSAMTFAWQEIAFKKEHQSGSFFGKASSVYLAGLLILGSLFLPFVRWAFDWLIDPAYSAALAVIPTAVLVGVANGYSNFIINIFYGLKDSRTVMWALLASAAANVVFVHLLVSFWGLNGANIAGIIALGLNALILQHVLHRRIDFKFDLRYLWPALAFTTVACVVYYRTGPWGNFAFGTAATLIALTVALILFRRRAATTN